MGAERTGKRWSTQDQGGPLLGSKKGLDSACSAPWRRPAPSQAQVAWLKRSREEHILLVNTQEKAETIPSVQERGEGEVTTHLGCTPLPGDIRPRILV